MTRLSPGDHRVLLAGVTAFVALVLATTGRRAVQDWRERAAEAARTQARAVAAARWRLAALDQIVTTLEERRTQLTALAPRMVGRGGPSAIAGVLATRLGSLADQAGLDLAAVRTVADTAAVGSFIFARAEAELIGDVRGLAQFLAAVETAPELLGLHALHVQQPDPAIAGDQVERLYVRVALVGVGVRGSGEEH